MGTEGIKRSQAGCQIAVAGRAGAVGQGDLGLFDHGLERDVVRRLLLFEVHADTRQFVLAPRQGPVHFLITRDAQNQRGHALVPGTTAVLSFGAAEK